MIQNEVVRVAGPASSQINVGDSVLRDEIVRTGLDSAGTHLFGCRVEPNINGDSCSPLPHIPASSPR